MLLIFLLFAFSLVSAQSESCILPSFELYSIFTLLHLHLFFSTLLALFSLCYAC